MRPKLIKDLLYAMPQSGSHGPRATGGNQVLLTLEPQETLNKVSVACEVQYFTALYLEHEGDFGKVAEVLLGDASHARKIQLRFNQLGLKVRDLKERLR